MATAKKAAKAAKTTGTEIANWDEELAKFAAQSVATEANTGSGLKAFSTQAGVLSFDDSPMKDNQMVVVVLDHILENTFYVEPFDSDNPTPPDAYALGRDDKTIRWSEDSIAEFNGEKIAGELCKDSAINQFGSADTGKGKACRNIRRLLVIPAGKIESNGKFKLVTDVEHYAEAAPAFLKVPPTSTPAWSLYVKQLAGGLNKPPFAVATLVKLVPDKKTQFKMTFEPVAELPPSLFEVLVKRHREAEELIMQPYNMDRGENDERSAKPKPAARGRAAKQAAAAGKKPVKKTGRKY